MDALALLLAATLNAGTVLAIAGLGLLINERAGIVNLGAEGMMLVAAIAGFATAVHTGNDWLAFGAGAVAGALMAATFGGLVIWLNTNQYATGLALSLFGVGFSAFAGIQYTQQKLQARPHFEIAGLADIPFIAPALTTFATWRPARVLLGAYLFGGVTMLQFHLQGEGVQIPSQFLTMLPYLATIVVLVLISRNATWIRVNMPASLGKPFFPGS